MASFEDLLKQKNKRLSEIPLDLQTVVEKQQREVLNKIIDQLDSLEKVNGQIKINNANLRTIANIDSELKDIFLNDEYLEAVDVFVDEFEQQATINSKLIKSGFGETIDPIVSKSYIDLAKKNALESLVGVGAEVNFILPVQAILENAVINGASKSETIENLRIFVEGNKDVESKTLKYVKQLTNTSFAVADRSYTSIISDYLDAEWFYYAGGEIATTRCFCEERVGKYFHYLEIESWGNGENLGKCNIGDGKWAGQIAGTNSKTIFSLAGGWECGHTFMPVTIDIVPESDIERARKLGFIN